MKLTLQEEQTLIGLAKKGNPYAVKKLVEANLDTIHYFARNRGNKILSEEDLVSEGVLGIVEALERFDQSKGHRFVTYAAPWIKAYILNALVQYTGTVRYPKQLHNAKRMLEKMYNVELNKGNFTIGEKEIGKVLKISKEAFLFVDLVNKPVFELDKPIGEDLDTGYNFIQVDYFPSPDSKVEEESMLLDISRAMKLLNENEKMVLQKFYTENKELIQIAEEMKLSKERVRQLKEKALQKLRKATILKQYIN